MRQRVLCLLAFALLLTPSVIGHGGHEDEFRTNAGRPREPVPRAPVPEGYTGPGSEPYVSYFNGAWLYGRIGATALGGQHPVDLDADGDWVVWEDAARSDIYAFSISAGQGFYITNDRWPQHNPRVSGNVVVYEDHRSLARPAVYAYFLDTGESRRLSDTARAIREPDIDWPIVAWLDENVTNPDIWAYSMLNNTGWNIHPGTDRDHPPVVIGEQIFWRTYRFNIWDIIGYDTRSGEEVQVTTDPALQSAPFSNGKELLFLTNDPEGGWIMERFDPLRELRKRTELRFSDTSRTSASGDAILRLAQDVDYAQLVVRNITTGATNHVSGNMLFAAPPIIHGRMILAPVETPDGVSLLMLQVSPFAFAQKPTLTITSPIDNTPWLRPIYVQGILQAGAEFTEPTTFTYRLDGGPPQIVPVAQRWRFTLDPNGIEPGRHLVSLRATFREGPPIDASVVLSIPAPSQSVDVERAGPAYHAARLMSEFNAYIGDNPASWFLMPLVLILVAIAIFRAWLWIKPKRRRVAAEYIAPDDTY